MIRGPRASWRRGGGPSSVLLQEVHGEPGDEATVAQELPGCVVQAPFGPNLGIDGVVVFLGVGIATRGASIHEEVAKLGRIPVVTVAGEHSHLVVDCVRINLRADSVGSAVFGGDFDSTSTGDAQHALARPRGAPKGRDVRRDVGVMPRLRLTESGLVAFASLRPAPPSGRRSDSSQRAFPEAPKRRPRLAPERLWSCARAALEQRLSGMRKRHTSGATSERVLKLSDCQHARSRSCAGVLSVVMELQSRSVTRVSLDESVGARYG